jgi:hypothetical protein
MEGLGNMPRMLYLSVEIFERFPHSSVTVPRKPHLPSPRYGIAEWYGRDMTTLTPEERQAFGQLAMHQCSTGDLSAAPVCPFLSTLRPGALCNKHGGVCSIRKFAGGVGKAGVPVPQAKISTLCPIRFLQPVNEKKSLLSWVAAKMLDITDKTIVKETPFLRKITDKPKPPEIADQVAAEVEEEGKKAGRIDWILVDPATLDADDPKWCAVETQALYFSGDEMPLEFAAYAAEPSPMLFPVGKRRPDYRSSGPKRLAPQLDVKVPVLRDWGKKVAVVVDRFFYDSMNRLEDTHPHLRDERERRENANIIWFIVDYDGALRLRESKIVYTSLDAARHALNATEPLSKSAFTNNLKQTIKDPLRSNKVFKVSE